MKKRFCLVTALMLALLQCAFFLSCSYVKAERSVTIASKQFTENILLSEMYAQLIENLTDIHVERRQNMGSTIICFTALEQGDVDMYVEYTGTMYKEILREEHEPSLAPEEFYNTAKKAMLEKKDIVVYPAIGLNNTYALAMPRQKAEAFGIKTMSDLSSSAQRLVFGANELYYTRQSDGYTTMTETYNLDFSSAVKMSNQELYEAVKGGQVDVMVVYATDSMLPLNDMIILEDDKKIFTEYYAAPIILKDSLKKYPELDEALNLLTGRIDNSLMQKLNYLVDIEKRPPEEVASTFLIELGLLTEN